MKITSLLTLLLISAKADFIFEISSNSTAPTDPGPRRPNPLTMDPKMKETLGHMLDYPDVPKGGWDDNENSPETNLNIYAQRLYIDYLMGKNITVDEEWVDR